MARPGDFSSADPVVAFARQVGAIKWDGTAQSADAGSVFTNTYSTRGTTAPTKQATITQTGAVWGVATLNDDYIFSSALFKRHSKVGPGGLGAVYVTTVGGATDASTFATGAGDGFGATTSIVAGAPSPRATVISFSSASDARDRSRPASS